MTDSGFFVDDYFRSYACLYFYIDLHLYTYFHSIAVRSAKRSTG